MQTFTSMANYELKIVFAFFFLQLNYVAQFSYCWF